MGRNRGRDALPVKAIRNVRAKSHSLPLNDLRGFAKAFLGLAEDLPFSFLIRSPDALAII